MWLVERGEGSKQRLQRGGWREACADHPGPGGPWWAMVWACISFYLLRSGLGEAEEALKQT